MRVAFDITLPARRITGVGVYAQELLAALGQRPLELRTWRRALCSPSCRPHRLANGVRLLHWHQVQIPRMVRRQSIDVYHSACPVGPVSGEFARVMTVHDASPLTMPAPATLADRLYQRIFSVMAAQRARAIIVPSCAARDAVAQTFGVPPDRLHVVPYGVGPSFRPVEPLVGRPVLKRLGVTEPYVLFVGAEPPRKNLPRLVRAFDRAIRSVGDVSTMLVLAGPAEPRDEEADAAVEGLAIDSRVKRLGSVEAADLPALYSGATCVAYPSLCEGFGFPVLEAMACGTPVLTSSHTSTAEISGDAALLVDAYDVDAMAQGLACLLSDNDLREDLRARGLERRRIYTWEQSATLTEAVYRAAATSGRG